MALIKEYKLIRSLIDILIIEKTIKIHNNEKIELLIILFISRSLLKISLIYSGDDAFIDILFFSILYFD